MNEEMRTIGKIQRSGNRAAADSLIRNYYDETIASRVILFKDRKLLCNDSPSAIFHLPLRFQGSAAIRSPSS